MNHLRISTRKSPLALWQAEHVRARLMAAHPGLEVELVKMSTEGDRILDAPLAKIGGKGLFVKELEQALLDRRADIAVHSLKDSLLTSPSAGLALSESPNPFTGRQFCNLTRGRGPRARRLLLPDPQRRWSPVAQGFAQRAGGRPEMVPVPAPASARPGR